MQATIDELRKRLSLIPELKKKYGLKPNRDVKDPLLFAGVVESNIIERLAPDVEAHFGPPYKAAGAGSFWKNLFDPFVRAIGGIRKDQTLYRHDVAPGVQLYCAFWPWGSNPVKTSVRIGLACRDEATGRALADSLAGCFGG